MDVMDAMDASFLPPASLSWSSLWVYTMCTCTHTDRQTNRQTMYCQQTLCKRYCQHGLHLLWKCLSMTEFMQDPFPITPLTGLNILVTGCNRGIGLGLVKRFLSEHGTRVVGTCRDPDSAAELQGLVHEYGTKRLILLHLDVTSKEELEELRRTIRLQGIEHLDIVIANAGIASKNHPFDPAMGSPEEDMMNTFRTNTLGTVFTAQSMVPLISMGKQAKLFVAMSSRHASITNTEGIGGFTSYRMSKAAMNMACMTLAQDPTIASIGIRFICMDPGYVDTAFGRAGGSLARKNTITVEECCNGVADVLCRAVEVQQVLMGDTIQDERSWTLPNQKTSERTSSSATSPEKAADISKCPYATTSLVSTPPIPAGGIALHTSAISRYAAPTPPTAHGSGNSPYIPSHDASQTGPGQVTTDASLPCASAIGATSERAATNAYAEVSLSSEADACPMGFTFATISEENRRKVDALREKMENITDPNAIERRLLSHNCVFVSYNGEHLPW